MVTGHYNTMNNGAKWSVDGNEVKMIHGFINYCKAQVDQAHRGDVVVKLLALCLKDETRRDTFLSTLAEQQGHEKEKGNLEWIRAQFLRIMRGDWQGSQFAAMVNISLGYEKPQTSPLSIFSGKCQYYRKL